MRQTGASVSIIMPCFNAEATLQQAVESVLSQGYHLWEIIIIDDASDAGTKILLERLTKLDKRIKALKNESREGVAFSRNKGLHHALGRFICFLDADDYMLPNSLSRRLHTMEERGCSVVYGPYLRLHSSGAFSRLTPPLQICFEDQLKTNYIGNLTGMYDTVNLDKIPQEKIRHEDYLMWCKILRKARHAFSVGGEPLAVYRVSNNSLSGNKLRAFIWHWTVLRRGLNIKIGRATYYQMSYLFYSLALRWREKTELERQLV
jgi:teichuronic acid biosynthesis glycosyltransferase TuaG